MSPYVAWRADRRAQSAYGFGEMATENHSYAPVCLACGGSTTYVRTIWRGTGPDLDVFRCHSCGLALSRMAPPDDPPREPDARR